MDPPERWRHRDSRWRRRWEFFLDVFPLLVVGYLVVPLLVVLAALAYENWH